MDEAAYNLTRSYITLKKAWNCRVAMSADKSFHVPLPMSLWGVVEPDHFHMDNHMNFVFHVELGKDGASGKIMGAAAYPGTSFVTPCSVHTVYSTATIDATSPCCCC